MTASGGIQSLFLHPVAQGVSTLPRSASLLLVFLAGACGALALAPFHLPVFMVVSLTVFIWTLDGVHIRAQADQRDVRTKYRDVALTAWMFGFGYHLSGLYWIGFAFLVEADAYAWMIPFVVVLMPGGLAVFTVLAALLAARFWGAGFARIVVLCVALALFEWLRGHILTGFPWNLYGYAFGFSPALMQNASLVGGYGLTLLLLLIFASPAVFAAPSLRSSRPWAFLLSMICVLTCLWGWGAWRLATASEDVVDGVRLRLVQPSVPQAEKWLPANKRRVFDLYMELTSDEGYDDVTHVIWPESALPYILNREPLRLAEIGALLGEDRTLLTGSVRIDSDGQTGERLFYNSLHVVKVSGAGQTDLLSTYDKTHLVPFGEYLPAADLLEAIGLKQLAFGDGGYSSGSELMTLAVPGAPQVVPLICYEVIFPGHILPEETDAEWIVNVTNDAWFGDTSGPRQHLAMARFRAIEAGLPIVRSANNGISAVIDAQGQIRASLDLNARGRLDADLPVARSGTPYALWGDLFFTGLMLFFAGLSIWRLYSRGHQT